MSRYFLRLYAVRNTDDASEFEALFIKKNSRGLDHNKLKGKSF